MQRKVDQVAGLQTIVDRINQALIFCEIDRFNRDRVQSISYLVGSLAATHMQVLRMLKLQDVDVSRISFLQISQAATTKWSEIVALSGLETSEFTDCVSAVYNNIDEEDIFGDA